MKGNSRRDRIFATVSWFIVLALLWSAVSLWVTPPTGSGPVGSVLGILVTQIVYSILYVVEAAFLAFSKFFKRNRMRKHTLLVIYLTGFFTSLLTIGIVGWVPGLLDNLLISISAAGCWLYWTFKTEYLTMEQFEAGHDLQV